MSTLRKYKKEAKKMFFASVKKDINKWEKGQYNRDYYSPTYITSYFCVERDEWLLIRSLSLIQESRSGTLSERNNIRICFYLFIIPINIKVWWYVLKLKRHFRKIRQDKKNEEEIKYLKSGLQNFHTNFVKEIRKEKLQQL